jgi:hypothetical protein
MDNGIGIIILAMVAVFLVARLYKVLGRRTGHERRQDPSQAPPTMTSGATRSPRYPIAPARHGPKTRLLLLRERVLST